MTSRRNELTELSLMDDDLKRMVMGDFAEIRANAADILEKAQALPETEALADIRGYAWTIKDAVDEALGQWWAGELAAAAQDAPAKENLPDTPPNPLPECPCGVPGCLCDGEDCR